MTARILIVDDVFPNIKLLEARLNAEYYNTLTAMNGPQALEICARGECDIVLLDVMMPGMDGFEVCRRLKNAPQTAHLPVVMVTALDQPSDRVKGLEAGADDFLTKPVNEIALLARVRSLVRLKSLTDELRARAIASPVAGGADALARAAAERGRGGRVLIVDDRRHSADRIAGALEQQHTVELEDDPNRSVIRAAEVGYDVIIISLGLQNVDPLRIVSQVRSVERTRQVPILVLADLDDEARVLRALDLGVNDYLMRPVDRNELLARVATQVRRKRYQERLRENVQASMEMAILDPLTGLHNRRYLDTQLAAMVADSAANGTPTSVVIVDLDHFKRVNDSHGHDAGDDVLKTVSLRLKMAVRGVDIVARFGGEEFVVAMPETEPGAAQRVAERIRRAIEADPILIERSGVKLAITASLGVASAAGGDISGERLIKLADEALYAAKHQGRNRVVLAAA